VAVNSVGRVVMSVLVVSNCVVHCSKGRRCCYLFWSGWGPEN